MVLYTGLAHYQTSWHTGPSTTLRSGAVEYPVGTA